MNQVLTQWLTGSGGQVRWQRLPFWLRWGSVWALALLLSTEIAAPLLPGFVRVTLAFGALLGFPGFLTAELLDVRQRWSRIQTLVLSIALGIGEVAILARIATRLHLQPAFVALVLALLALVKLSLLRQRSVRPGRVRQPVDVKLVIQWAVLLIVIIWFAGNTLISPDHINHIKTDYWIYLGFQTQFVENAADPNMQVGVFTTGTNIRLQWSSWHYLLAVLMDITHVHPVDFQSRDILFALHVFAILVTIALARELFEHREAAYFTGILHAGLLTANFLGPAIYAQRLVEDKFFSLFVFIPLAFLLVVRVLDKPSRQDWVIAGVVLTSAALLHPFNAIAINFTIVGYVVLRAIINRRAIPLRRVVLLLVCILALLVVPLAEREVLTEDELVEEGLSRSTTAVAPDYVVENAFWDAALNSSVFILFGFILLLAAVRATVDRGALFIVVVSGIIFWGLWVPPFSALLARVITTSINWRLFMLVPIGIGWGWLFLQCWRGIKPVLPEWFPKAALALLGLLPFVAHYALWVAFPYRSYFEPEYRANFWYRRTFQDTYWQVLMEGMAIVADGTVGVAADFSRRVPTFWPDARLPYYLGAPGLYRPEDRPPVYHDLHALFYMEPGIDPAAITRQYSLDYLVLEKSMPLESVLTADWPCCTLVYNNPNYAIYAARYDIEIGQAAEDEIETPLNLQIGNIARLRGYRLQAMEAGTQVTLFWEPLAASESSLTVFVHLIGEINPATNTPLWGQDDHRPRMGQLDTTSWPIGTLWADAYALPTDALPPGEYDITVGMYDPVTGVRQPVFDADGESLEDTITLTTLYLEPVAP